MFSLIRRLSGDPDPDPDPDPNNNHDNPNPNHNNAPHNSEKDDGINGVFSPFSRDYYYHHHAHAQPSHSRCMATSPFLRPPPLDPIILHDYCETETETGTETEYSRLLSYAVAEEIRSLVPERLRIEEDWRLVYSLERDGSSLGTLYAKCGAYGDRARAGFVLVVQDQEGGTFGAYLSEYPHPATSYFGNGECFLWRASTLASLPPPPSSAAADAGNLTRSTTLAATTTTPTTTATTTATTESIRFKAFPYSGLNDFCIHCETGFLSVGSGGGHYGLWLDDSLDVGRSAMCETFGNEPLSDAGHKFSVVGVEVWVLGC